MPLWSHLAIGAAAVRVATALALYLSGGSSAANAPLPFEIYAGLTAAFAVLGLILLTANRDDVRASWLGGILLLVASPLCSPLLAGRTTSDLGWLLFVRADAFLPAFLWRFVSEFPTRLIGRPHSVTRVVGHVALGLGAVVAAINLSYLVAPLAVADWRASLTPVRTAGSFYYPLIFGLSAAAFPMLLWRARRAQQGARRQVLIFSGGLIGGSLPLILQSMLDAIPAYNAFVHQQRPVELLLGIFLFASLASVPFVTAYSVLFDEVVDLRVVLRAALRYLLARYTIFVVTAIPFAAFAVVMVQHRAEPIAALFSGPRPLLLGAAAAAGLIALRLRHRWLEALDRRFFREQYDARQIVDQLMRDALVAHDANALEICVQQGIERGLHATAALFIAPDGEGWLQRPSGHGVPLRSNGVLASLAATDPVPMNIGPGSDSPFRRLPPDERQWVLEWDFRIVLALRGSANRLVGLLALTAKRSGLPYSADDRRLLAGIGASISLALDNLRLRATSDVPSEPAALECHTCSRLNPSDAAACSCGGPVFPATAPYVLRGVFRLDRRLGAGGMGVVYHARDLNLGRSVAIKTLPRMTAEHAAQLRREARAMASVTHTNLAVIHGIETWRGIPFLIQEFLPGGTLSDRLGRGRLQPIDAIDLVATLAAALDALHRAGVIHRDVKPSNIGFSAAGVTKLLDFGLARLGQVIADESSATSTALGIDRQSSEWSSPGALVGTLPYMSPEALRAEPANPSFDLWSLAVVLYECITGHRPFAGRDAGQMLYSTQTPATAPSALCEGCPAAVDHFMSAALHHDSSRRAGSAERLRGDLLELRQAC